jgi:soluble lytic murein transglycosylase
LPVVLATLLIWAVAHADEAHFKKAGALARNNKPQEAVKVLEALEDAKLERGQLARKYFAQGLWAHQSKDYKLSEEYLRKSIELKVESLAYAHYLMAQAYRLSGRYQESITHYQKTLDLDPPQQLSLEARYELSEVLTLLDRPSPAHVQLKVLERRLKNTHRHPDVIWKLIGNELRQKQKWQACRWARLLYSRYPEYEKASSWGVDLPKNQYEDKELGCLVTTEEMRKRFRRLQLSGFPERARAEIEVIRQRAPPHARFEADMMLVDFLDYQGFVTEALALIMNHYQEYKGNFNYQHRLARVSAKAGEYPTAIGAYHKAYRLNAGSKKGREALFSAAFLSYQVQDYDGATTKFQDLIKRYPGSGLARDATWHLAWLRYLRSDYKGASEDFRALLKSSYRKRHRWIQPYNNERTMYWLAMSEFKQKKFSEARELLTPLANQKNWSFYSIVAKERLEQIPQSVAPRLPAEVQVTEAEVAVVLDTEGGPTVSDEAESESEETVADSQLKQDDPPEQVAEVESAEEAREENKEASIIATEFKDPRLQARFDRAQFFILIGADDWARGELFEIERRTRNKNYLRRLMDAYRDMGFYNRTMYISEVYFPSERVGGGLEKAKDLWRFNFPQAYDNEVLDAAARFNVEKEFIWAIMRAESSYNKSVISPVGARGLMQVMPYTAARVSQLLNEKEYNNDALLNPMVNVRYGARYLARLNRKFASELPLSAAAYNAGPHRVDSWLSNFGNLEMDAFIEHIPFPETRNYVKKVVRNYVVYRTLYSGKEPVRMMSLVSPIAIKVADRPAPRENWESLD